MNKMNIKLEQTIKQNLYSPITRHKGLYKLVSTQCQLKFGIAKIISTSFGLAQNKQIFNRTFTP